VVAEGVESEASMNLLTAYGCDLMQGYYLSRAVDRRDITGLVGRGTRAGCR